MAINGKMITQAQAKTMRDNYEASSAFAANDNFKALLFDKDLVDQVLGQPTCVGVRIYYGKYPIVDGGKSNMILVGVDTAGNDLMGKFLDMGSPCPIKCAKNPW